MEWVKNRLRRWLFPEIAEKLTAIREIRTRVTSIDNSMRLLQRETLAMLKRETKKAEKTLADRADSAIVALRYRHKVAMEELSGELGAMFYVFPGRKRIAVKNVLRLLLDRQRLTVRLVKENNGELSPIIRKKRSAKEGI